MSAERTEQEPPNIARRFRGFVPVVVDVETGGLDPQGHALLELAAVLLDVDEHGRLYPAEEIAVSVHPSALTAVDPVSIKIHGIDPSDPEREAMEERAALDAFFRPIRRQVKALNARRAILVGHNAPFDLAVVKAACERTGYKRNPFHPFSTLDTVTAAAVAVGETVLAKAVTAAGFDWDNSRAHGALYDAQKTAELFCHIINSLSTETGQAALRVREPRI
ncbi:MAG: ribonuclease T [Guyparkeria sp.]|uniref:ribonuclease T n=1 Tax=Guyparkeria sp. TaxID=2035736 RepID=UPI00397E2665